MLEQILQGIGIILGAMLSYLITLLINKIKSDSIKKSLQTVVEAATARVQDEFVDFKKQAAADGKLTKEDRDLAVAKVVEIANDLAPEKLKTELQKLPIDKIRAMIQTFIAKKG